MEVCSDKVSVIMPAYNAEATISDSIKSVLGQSYFNLELLIVDDCSNDLTGEISAGFAKRDSRVTYISNVENRGVASARNRAISLSEGKYIAFLDADDLWEVDKLDLQIQVMKKEGFYLSHGSYIRFSSDSPNLGEVFVPRIVSYSDMLEGNFIGNLTGIYDASVLGKCYQKDVGHEDYLMWLNLLSKSDSVGVESIIARYRIAPGALSANKIQSSIWHYRILRHELKFGFFKATQLWLSYIINALKKRR